MTNTTNTQKGTDLLRRINSRLKQNPAWRELFTATSKVITEYVTRPRNELTTLRDSRKFRRGDWVTIADGRRVIINHIKPNEAGDVTVYAQVPGTDEAIEFTLSGSIHDRTVLVQGAAFHGFSYFSDTLSDADYARIIDWVEIYWPANGTESFARFMGFIKNMKLSIHHLYSDETVNPFEAEIKTEDGVHFTKTGFADTEKDYYPYLEVDPIGRPNWLSDSDDAAYLTSHVELAYDAVLTPNPDYVDLFYLFYYLAPIHLVLERIVAEITPEPVYVNQSPPVGFLNLHEMGVFSLEPDGYINLTVAPSFMVSLAEGAYLELDSDFSKVAPEPTLIDYNEPLPLV